MLVAFSTVALVPVSKADTVTYTFSGTDNAPGGDGLIVAFQYTASGFLIPSPPNVSLLASQLDSCTNCEASGIPAVVFQQQSLVFGDQIDFSDILDTGSAFAFPFGAFATPGTYYSTSPYNSGTLIVSTPEPATLLLLSCGLSLLVGVSLLRRLRSTFSARA
jgi:hypothetical protein